MAAVPKNKRSKSKRDMKRNSFKLAVLSIVECPRCRAKKVSHRVCLACGYYDNKEIIKVEKQKKEKGKEKTRQTEKEASKAKQAAGVSGRRGKTAVAESSPGHDSENKEESA